MKYVIERDGEYYAGFFEGRPVWQRKCRPETQFDAATADLILKQLQSLNYRVELKLYSARVRGKKRLQSIGAEG